MTAMNVRELCKTHTALGEKDIARLEAIADTIQLTADLTGSDVFIDCLCPKENAAIVVAEAKPRAEGSAYCQTVVGKTALPHNEPAVFHAFASGMPVRDLKAITQENQSVKQDVVPIVGEDGGTIGVLIREKDISRSLLRDKKYEELAREREGRNDKNLTLLPVGGEHDAAMREVHHRVKNNLQLVASILNMQARKCPDPGVKQIFAENVGRVLSIAAIHDILTVSSGDGMRVSSKILLEKLRRSLQSLVPEGKVVPITVEGDDILLEADKATSVSLVVSELITNALEHAFEGRAEGHIVVTTQAGNLYSTVSVEDDGVGFDPAVVKPSSLGLSIVAATVKDKLGGELRISSSQEGTKVLFDFKNQ